MKLNPAAPLPANIMVHEGSDRAELREVRRILKELLFLYFFVTVLLEETEEMAFSR